MPYVDFRHYLSALKELGLLRTVGVPVDKDWELSCIMRRIFRELPEEFRYGVLFENIIGFKNPVAVGVCGASREIYAAGLRTDPDEIKHRWIKALTQPVEPKVIPTGPCKERIFAGPKVDLTSFPIPTWTPGLDAGPYITSACVITRDPEDGIYNVGTYRLQVKGKTRTGILILPEQHIGQHFEKYKRIGKPMPVAVAIGNDPALCMVAVAKVPYLMDEYAVAGGLRGAPLELVPCHTNELLAPAHSEIILEGEITLDELEDEGPFGEFTGFMGPKGQRPVLSLKAITCRDDAIYHAYISQMPPSESTKLRGIGHESLVYKHLAHDLGLPGIHDVHLTETSTSLGHLIVKMTPKYQGHTKQVLSAAWTHDPTVGKIVSVVDEDIDIRDPHQVDWAYSFRMQPARDVTIIKDVAALPLDPSTAPPEAPLKEKLIGSKMLIDATKKWEYPAVALPKKDEMEAVRKNWAAYGLPDIK